MNNDDKNAKRPAKRMPKKKVCAFCAEKIEVIDYKDLPRLKKFITEKGKILPRRMSGVCAAHQRELAEAVKRARVMALLPFKGE
jgi:small subunit ribosomal protein S18